MQLICSLTITLKAISAAASLSHLSVLEDVEYVWDASAANRK